MTVSVHKKEPLKGNREGEKYEAGTIAKKKKKHTKKSTSPEERIQFNTTPTSTLSTHIIPHQASTL